MTEDLLRTHVAQDVDHAARREALRQAITDYDEEHHHDNEITNILEGRDAQVLYQVEKDWHYRKEERRWVPMNDQSAWNRVVITATRTGNEQNLARFGDYLSTAIADTLKPAKKSVAPA